MVNTFAVQTYSRKEEGDRHTNDDGLLLKYCRLRRKKLTGNSRLEREKVSFLGQRENVCELGFCFQESAKPAKKQAEKHERQDADKERTRDKMSNPIAGHTQDMSSFVMHLHNS
jgi:hypothetical protein